MQGVDGCFHLAAIASVELGNRDWLGTHRTNLTGAITIFDAARRAQPDRTVPVVYASSAAVYGDTPDLPLAETAATRPLSAYGADKLGCELHAGWRPRCMACARRAAASSMSTGRARIRRRPIRA
jgi:UDP-glucose 4-epimerase